MKDTPGTLSKPSNAVRWRVVGSSYEVSVMHDLPRSPWRNRSHARRAHSKQTPSAHATSAQENTARVHAVCNSFLRPQGTSFLIEPYVGHASHFPTTDERRETRIDLIAKRSLKTLIRITLRSTNFVMPTVEACARWAVPKASFT